MATFEELQKTKQIHVMRNGKEVDVLSEVPDGWKELEGSMTQPIGYAWYYNGKGFFGGEFQSALVKIS